MDLSLRTGTNCSMLAKTNHDARLACRGDVAAETQLLLNNSWSVDSNVVVAYLLRKRETNLLDRHLDVLPVPVYADHWQARCFVQPPTLNSARAGE